MKKTGVFLIGGLILAIFVTVIIGKPGVNYVKIGGVALSVFAFLPVFIVLVKSLGRESVTFFLAIFVGGFVFKLVIILAGIWFFVARLDWDVIDFVISCMIFMLVFQLYESLYFWGKKEEFNENIPPPKDRTSEK